MIEKIEKYLKLQYYIYYKIYLKYNVSKVFKIIYNLS